MDIVVFNKIRVMTKDELNQSLCLAASQVKLSTGVCNNAAWCAVLEAHDHIRNHPKYRDMVKREYRKALSEFHMYENKLLYATCNRMFRVADISDATRKKYGNITDREYYDFWASTGATA